MAGVAAERPSAELMRALTLLKAPWAKPSGAWVAYIAASAKVCDAVRSYAPGLFSPPRFRQPFAPRLAHLSVI
jgi:hypothetical protein